MLRDFITLIFLLLLVCHCIRLGDEQAFGDEPIDVNGRGVVHADEDY